MNEFNNDNIQDVDYIEVPDKTIRGESLYYSTSQVAKILDLSDSKVRYYSTVFADILNIEFHNKQRRFTKADIDKLRFLTELKEEGMTIKQIQEYCQEVDFENGGEIQVKETNPLSIQTLAKALTEQQQLAIEKQNQVINMLLNKITDMELVITESERNIKSEIASTQESFQERMSIVLQEVVVDTCKNEFQSFIDQRELDYKNRDNEIIDALKKHMEDSQRKFEENNAKKSFWSRIFNK